MIDEHKHLKNTDRADEVNQPGDKPLKGETIKSKDDNARQERQKLIDAARSFKLTGDGQMSFQIHGNLDDKTINVKDSRAPRTTSINSSHSAHADARTEPNKSLHGRVESGEEKEKAQERTDHGHHPQMEEARAKLDQAAKHLRDEGKMSPEDYLRFKDNMDRLRDRVNLGYVDDIQAEKVYQQMEKLITEPKAVVSEKNRILLAENVLYHAAWPHKIDQGVYNTCNMTTVEEHLFTRYPSKAAEIITSAALHGSFVDHGKTIKIDSESLWPQKEALKSPPDPGDRSYASQVLNVLLVNDVVQRRTPPQYYSQIPFGHIDPTGGDGDATHRSATNPNDNGERLTDGHGNEIHKYDAAGHDLGPIRAPDSAGWPTNIANEVERLTGDKDVVIANANEDTAANVLHVHNARELDDVLKHHKMPMILVIDVNNPPWNYGSATPAWHVVTIQSYDAKHRQAHVSNQWGPKADKDYSVDTLFAATEQYMPPPPPLPSPGP